MKTVADERTAVAGALASLLAAATLSPLVSGITWLVVAGVIVVTVMVAGIIGRHLLKSPVPVTIVQLIVLLIALEVLFARSRILEGPGAVTALIDLLKAGLQLTREQPPPVDATQGVILLAAGGTGVVALLVDVLACSFRQPALAGLPLLAVYCVPAALLPDGLPWYYFAAAAAGFMILLSADSGERIQSWGRVLSAGNRRRGAGNGGNGGDGPGEGLSALTGLGTLGTLGSGGRRAAAVTVLAAVLLPTVMPGLGNQILGGTDGDGTGSGGRSSITRINPILNLRQDLNSGADTNVITYTTDAVNPEPLRIVTADTYDGKTWAPNKFPVSLANKAQNALPVPQGLGAGIATTTRTMQITIGRTLAQTYLPLPYPTTSVDVDGEWFFDPATLNVIGNQGVTTANRSYTAQYLQVQPTPSQLEAAPSPVATLNPVYLSLPPNLPASIKKTAEEVVKGASSQYEQAVKLQDWLRSPPFVYTTDAPRSPNGDSSADAIATFLQVKRGYCVHFASTMAVMARMLNIPARVGIGFLPGDLQSDGTRVISMHDAHAWPELYFEGVGWVRFEPTPRSGFTTVPSWAIPPAATTPDVTASAAPTASQSAQTRPTPSASVTTASSGQSSGSGGGLNVPWRLVLAALVVAGALMTPLLAVRLSSARRWRRASTPAARAEAAWTELRLGLEDLGATWAWTWTPRGVRERLGAEYDLGDAGTSALARLVTAIEAARYAPPAELSGASSDSSSGADPMVTLTADLTTGDELTPAGSSGSPGLSLGSSGLPSGASSGAPSGLREDVRMVLARIAATMPRGRRWRARWAPPSAGAVLASLVTLRRNTPAGPDAEALATSRGEDTLEQQPRTDSQRTHV